MSRRRLSWRIVSGSCAGLSWLLACAGDFVDAPPGGADAAVADAVAPPSDAGTSNVDASSATCTGDPCDVVKGQVAREVVVSGDDLYWTTLDGVFRKDRRTDSGPITTLAAGQIAPKGLTVTPTHAFWLTTVTCPTIHRWSLGDSKETTAPATIGDPRQSAFADGKLYYTGVSAPSGCAGIDGGAGGLRHVNVDLKEAGVVGTGDLFPNSPCLTAPTVAVAARTGDVVWGHAETGELCWSLGQELGLQVDSWNTVSAIAFTAAGDLYFTSAQGVFWQKRSELADAARSVAAVTDATAIVADDARGKVYFVTRSGKVYEASGNTSELLRETGCSIGSVAQDSDALYFPCEGEGTIKRLKKP